jgi:hypothetical protein
MCVMRMRAGGSKQVQRTRNAYHDYNPDWQSRPIHHRAQELNLSLPENLTTAQAVEVLRRHGEPLGISEEVLDMEVEIPCHLLREKDEEG